MCVCVPFVFHELNQYCFILCSHHFQVRRRPDPFFFVLIMSGRTGSESLATRSHSPRRQIAREARAAYLFADDSGLARDPDSLDKASLFCKLAEKLISEAKASRRAAQAAEQTGWTWWSKRVGSSAACLQLVATATAEKLISEARDSRRAATGATGATATGAMAHLECSQFSDRRHCESMT